MRPLLASVLLLIFLAGVTLVFALGMGQLRGEWLLQALALAVALAVVTAPVLAVRD